MDKRSGERMPNMNSRGGSGMCVIFPVKFLDRHREPLTSFERRRQRIFVKSAGIGPPAVRLLFSIVVLPEVRTQKSPFDPTNYLGKV